VDKALKRFKKKFEKTGVLKELRARQAFEKPSIRSRQQRLRAVYRQQLLQTDVV
ncbi:MAG: 30S ribosomal protein S21, partial [Sphingobacteriia bacterium]|nr:30S ribosomal protein S21 [Sphingobacteriia bacterium]